MPHSDYFSRNGSHGGPGPTAVEVGTKEDPVPGTVVAAPGALPLPGSPSIQDDDGWHSRQGESLGSQVRAELVVVPAKEIVRSKAAQSLERRRRQQESRPLS